MQQFGAGAGASRLICGSLRPHHDLEEALASFKGRPSRPGLFLRLRRRRGRRSARCLTATMSSRVDKLVHACIVDAARLSGAKLRVFGHNNLNDLEKILRWADRRHAAPPLTPSDRRPHT